MPTAVEKLTAMLGDDDPFDHPREELEPLWLEAVNERLAQRKDEIPVLGKLVEATGIKEITALDDLIPLLFAHTNYKSYPQAFIAKGRWPSMNAWLDTVSVERVDRLDGAAVERRRNRVSGQVVYDRYGGDERVLPGRRWAGGGDGRADDPGR